MTRFAGRLLLFRSSLARRGLPAIPARPSGGARTAGHRPRDDRHSAGGRRRIRRQHGRDDAPSRRRGGGGPRLHVRSRPQSSDAAVAHEHPHGSLSLPARRAGQRRLPARARGSQRPRRSSRRRGMRPAPSSRRSRSIHAMDWRAVSTATRSCTGTSRSRRTSRSSRAPRETCSRGARLVQEAGRPAPVPLGPPVRPACPVRSAVALQGAIRGHVPPVRSRMPTPRSSRCSMP